MREHFARSLCLVLGTVVCFASTVAPAHAADPGCQGARVPVPALAPSASIYGVLCPSGGAPSSTVMVLVPGASYNHTYWDFPYQPQVYNFRQAMNAAGYATFTLDRLGTGASTRPLSATVTTTLQAVAVHDVILALRAGRIGSMPFTKVILGGHSLGSAVAILEAGTYNDEDGVVLTGVTHSVNAVGAATAASSLYPAPLDSAFAGKLYDPGYLTTRPGTRESDFYQPATTDPAVLAEDEATKDVFSSTETGDTLVGVLSPYSVFIRAPVLLADGSQDNLFCTPLLCSSASALAAGERPYYAGSSCLQTYLLPGAGHDVNLATDTQAYQRAVVNWADAFVGAGATQVLTPACTV